MPEPRLKVYTLPYIGPTALCPTPRVVMIISQDEKELSFPGGSIMERTDKVPLDPVLRELVLRENGNREAKEEMGSAHSLVNLHNERLTVKARTTTIDKSGEGDERITHYECHFYLHDISENLMSCYGSSDLDTCLDRFLSESNDPLFSSRHRIEVSGDVAIPVQDIYDMASKTKGVLWSNHAKFVLLRRMYGSPHRSFCDFFGIDTSIRSSLGLPFSPLTLIPQPLIAHAYVDLALLYLQGNVCQEGEIKDRLCGLYPRLFDRNMSTERMLQAGREEVTLLVKAAMYMHMKEIQFKARTSLHVYRSDVDRFFETLKEMEPLQGDLVDDLLWLLNL